MSQENTIIMVDKKNYITLLQNSNGQYIVEWSDGSAHEYCEAVADIDAKEVILGKKELISLVFKARNGTWPLPQKEQEKAERNFIRETPTALISDPTSISLFSKEELEKLIPIAEKQWIDWKGKLPENYESPLT